jgi:hypothetical protein
MEIDLLEGLYVDGRMILKWGSECGQGEFSREHGIEPSDSIKYREFLDQLRN